MARNGFLVALVYLTLVSAGFFVVGALSNHSWAFWYLIWNLFLAWLPLILALLLARLLGSVAWSSWRGLALTLLWLGFLPNSFYMVSDILHLQDYQRVNIVYDTVMFTMFVLCGLILGYASVVLVHVELAKRLRSPYAVWAWLSAVLLLCSFAIYLGRDLRLSTWDLLISPAGILFDVSDIILRPTQHLLAFTTTLTFFVFLMTVYIVVWQFVCKPHVAHHSSRQYKFD